MTKEAPIHQGQTLAGTLFNEPDIRLGMRDGIETEATGKRRKATAKVRHVLAELLPMWRA